jgi:hypothetical protein
MCFTYINQRVLPNDIQMFTKHHSLCSILGLITDEKVKRTFDATTKYAYIPIEQELQMHFHALNSYRRNDPLLRKWYIQIQQQSTMDLPLLKYLLADCH